MRGIVSILMTEDSAQPGQSLSHLSSPDGACDLVGLAVSMLQRGPQVGEEGSPSGHKAGDVIRLPCELPEDLDPDGVAAENVVDCQLKISQKVWVHCHIDAVGLRLVSGTDPDNVGASTGLVKGNAGVSIMTSRSCAVPATCDQGSSV